VTLAVALLMAILVAPTRTAFAVSGNVSKAGPPSLMTHDGNSPGDKADPGDAGSQGDNANRDGTDESGNDRDNPCMSVSSTAPAAGPVTVCPGRQAG
jgi:hypothetical protein